jgi:hypothetical protein
MAVAGGCRCGAVRYTLAVDVLPPSYACHCHQCQRWSGSAFSQQVLVAEDAVALTGPVILVDRRTSDERSGDRVSSQRFCGECHTRLYNTNTRRPGIAVVRAGTLDDSERLECRAHIFTEFRQRWFALPDDVPAWPDAPDMGRFMALLLPPGGSA